MSLADLETYERVGSVRPIDYFGPIYEWMDEGFSNGLFAIHRDSEILEISNYETVKKLLAGHINNEDLVRVTSSNHWAVGWVETIHIKMRNRHGKFTRPFKLAVNILLRLEDYPVLDEFDYSEREHNDLWEWVDTEVQDTDKCVQWLYDNYSVSRGDDVRYEWIETWRKENEPDD